MKARSVLLPSCTLIVRILCATMLFGTAVAQSTPQATHVLQQASARMLGVTPPSSISAHGTITYVAGEATRSGTVILSVTKDDAIVFTTVVDRVETTLRAHGFVAERSENGKQVPLPVSVAERVHLLGAPFALTAITARHTWSVDATVAVGARTAHRLSAHKPNISLLLDTDDLVVTAADVEPSDPGSVQSRFVFGNYRLVEGLYLPFSIAEQVGNQTTWRIQFDNIVVNSSAPGM